MMFRKEERTCQTPLGWRLATVKEARRHVESIKSHNLLGEWDRARLLDGWIGGSGYEFKAHVGFRSCVGYMLLVQSPQQVENIQPDEVGNCPYSEATLLDEQGRNLVDEKGMSVALFLCCEDWNYDVLYWLLNYWSSNGTKLKIAKDMQPCIFEEMKHTSNLLNKVARHLQNTRTMKRQPNEKFARASMRGMISAIVESIKENTTEDFLKKMLDDVLLADIGGQIWYEMDLTNDLARFQGFQFDTKDTSTREAVADIVWSVAAEATAVLIIRYCISEKNKNINGECLKGETMDDMTFVASIVVHANRLLDGTFFGYNSIWKEVRKGAEAAQGDCRSFEEMLRDQGFGTFGYDGQHGVLNTILVQAAKEAETKLLNRLIEWGVQPLNTDDKRQKTALHHAAKLEDESLGAEIAKKLLEGPSSEKLANARDCKGRTPLHRAALCGHAHVCRLLLDHKASVVSKDYRSQIPLHYALLCEPKNKEVINDLISVDPEVIDWKDDQGKTPLDVAVEYEGINNMVAWLLSLSSQPEAYFKKLDLVSCLRESSARGDDELVKKLLEAGANPLEGDQEGKTALHYAVECQKESQAFKVVRELLMCKYGMELVIAYDKYGRNVLHIVAFVGHKKLCKLLLSIDGVDLDREDRDGQRALYYAAAGTYDDDELLDVLIFGGYFESEEMESQLGNTDGMEVKDNVTFKGSTNIVDLKDSRGTTPLHVAAAKGKVRMVRKLLSKRLIPKSQDRENFVRAADVIGQTALHKAASGGHRRVVQILLDNGAHPLNERDCDGKTALHYAAQAEKSGNVEDAVEIGKLLLKKCNFEEKSLLLFAFAVGIGSADESLEPTSKLQQYLVNEKQAIEKELQQGNNLLRGAATLGNIDMTRELLARGANIADIRNKEWTEKLEDNEKKNVQEVLNQIDNIVEHIIEQGTDKPALQDSLGRIEFANGLAALFLNPFVKSPITVGVSGEWGMGKSSVMAQTESILLKTSAYVTFSNSLQHKNLPGAKKPKLSPNGEKKHSRVKNSIEQLNQKSSKQSRVEKKTMHSYSTTVEDTNSDPLNEFLNKNYQPQYEKVYKSLAAMDRKDLFEHEERDEEATIPSILTVRYNAWEYMNESEAWAGLVVAIAKELEAAIPVAQTLYNSWRYNKHRIWRDVIFPCLLVVILALWFTIIVWILLDRTHGKKFKDLIYGSFPITLLVIVWTGIKSVMSVVKPVSSQMVDYLSLPDHSSKLGYQKKVIEDIKFLKEDALSHRPSNMWRAFAWIWYFLTFSWDERYVHSETRMPKMTPASKDQLRMVVFVDDLDRCEENVILKILSAINLVLAVCKIDVIIGMDKSMIERAVKRKFDDRNNNSSKSSQDLADKYLKKIVQLPLDLPDPSHLESRKFLRGHLGMLDTSDSDTGPAPKEKEKVIPKFRIGLRNHYPGQEETRLSGGREKDRSSDTARGADSHLLKKKEQRNTIGESSQCLQVEIHKSRGDQTGELSNFGEKQDRGVPTAFSCLLHSGVLMGDKGLITCFRKWTSYLSSLYKYGDNTQSQGKEKPPENEDQGKEKPTPKNNMPTEMIIPKYTEGEGKAFQDLQIKATGSRKLPREWKRLINYHRLAWNILSKRQNVTELDGWQVQLIAWIFVCWEWKDQINLLIQKWHKLDVLKNWVTHHQQQGEAESSGPSLREIVEEYMDGRWSGVKGNSAKPGRASKSAIDIHESSPPEKATTIPMSKLLDANYIKRAVRDVLKEEREQEQEHSLKIKEVEGSEKEEPEDRLKAMIRKVVQEEKELENWFKELIRKVLAEEKEQEGKQNFRAKECDKGKGIVVSEISTEENSLKQEEENKERTSHIQKGKIKDKEATQEEKEREQVKEAEQEEKKGREEEENKEKASLIKKGKGKTKVKEAEQEEEEKEREEMTRLRKTLSKKNISKGREEIKEAEQEEKEKEQVKEAEQEEEEKEREEWTRLRKTLSKYNISMDGIQAFQNFRFHCVAGYLPWPLPEE